MEIKKINPKTGKYISAVDNISKMFGMELLFLTIFAIPLPNEATIND